MDNSYTNVIVSNGQRVMSGDKCDKPCVTDDILMRL